MTIRHLHRRRFSAALLPGLILPALLAWSLVFPSSSRAVIIGVDSFDYADGALAGKNGGQLWNWRNRTPAARSTGGPSDWDNVKGVPVVSGARLITNDNSVTREYNGPGEGSSADITRDDGLGAISKFTNGGDISFQEQVVYYKVTFTTGATLPAALGVSSYDFGTEQVFFGKTFNHPNFGIGIASGLVESSLTAVQPNTTYTIVAKLDYPAGRASLFINPEFSASSEPAPAVSIDFDTSKWSSALRLAGDGPAAVTWDNLVVCTKWTDLLTVVVTTEKDEDDGLLGGGTGLSLREAVKYAPAGARITFAPDLSGKTIILTHADGDLSIPEALTVDATMLAAGLTVDGNHTSRHFDVGEGKALTLRGLRLTKGNGSGSDGGSIKSGGNLVLDRCLLSGNGGEASGTRGGAVSAYGSQGRLRAVDCTFADNSIPASLGGGIFITAGSMELFRCALSGNTASAGGCLWIQGQSAAVLDRCTISGNTASASGESGGLQLSGGTIGLRHCTVTQNTGNGGPGIRLQSPVTANLDSCLIAGNSNGNTIGPVDINVISGTLNAIGANLIGSNESVEAKFPAGPLAGTKAAPLNPGLDQEGFHGGGTQTFSLLPGSPARDAATGSTATSDQRGFPMLGTPDLGSFEAQFSLIPDLTVTAGTTTVEVPFRAGQVGLLTASSSNPTVVSSEHIVFSGMDTDRTAGITLTPNQTGSTFITFFSDVSDVSDEFVSFLLTVTPATPPDLVVTSAADSGAGSLREKIAAAATHPGADTITFAPGFTGPITLNSELALADTGGSVTIDATGVAGGLKLDAKSNSRHFSVPAGNALQLIGFTLANGNGGGGNGGSINNLGTLLLDRCLLTGNKAAAAGASGGAVACTGSGADLRVKDCAFSQNATNRRGGGVFVSDGKVSLTRCTLTGNSAERAGGFWMEGNATARVDRCTVSGNKVSGDNAGGGIECLAGNIDLFHCTITQNTGTNGGGVHLADAATGQFRFCLIAGNTDANGGAADIRLTDAPTLIGINLIGSNQSVESQFPAGPLAGTAAAPLDGKLAPLGDYGGLTQTFALRPGSPARNAATGGPDPDTDQRGFPMVGVPDFGAYEAGNQLTENYTIYIQETLPATASTAQHDRTADYDGDGQSNESEWLTGTGADGAASAFRPFLATNGIQRDLMFPTVRGRQYALEQSDTMAPGSWIPTPGRSAVNGDGSTGGWGLPDAVPGGLPAGVSRRFYRVRITR